MSAEARRRFKKALPGIINVRTDGTNIYAFRGSLPCVYQRDRMYSIASLVL